VNRRTVMGAGIVVGAGALAACSTYGSQPAATGESSSADSSSEPAQPKVITQTSTVPVGGGVIAGDVVVTQPTSGTFLGFSTVCPHAGCNVNKVVDGTIDCPCHGSKFHLDGTVANGPAKQPLATRDVTVRGGDIVLG
jgi:Rieske Fe-S protein